MFTRIATAAAVLAALATPLLAQGRPDARRLTCEQVHRLISERGAVVMTTGRHTYDRFVGAFGSCTYPEVPRLTSIQTRDTDRCPVYNCQPDPFQDW